VASQVPAPEEQVMQLGLATAEVFVHWVHAVPLMR
jgi:hypothetical protein